MCVNMIVKTGDALHACRANLEDPNNVLQSWDPTLVNPSTWLHITCDVENNVVRVYVKLHYLDIFRRQSMKNML